MSSFATNAVCAHRPLCTRESMEKAVDTLSEALEGSANEDSSDRDAEARRQLKLELASTRKTIVEKEKRS